jgi:hypothetical protein
MAPAADLALRPVACDLSVFEPREGARHAELLDMVRHAIVDTEELDSGLRFTLGPAAFAAAAEWFAYERRCCPFFDFDLSWTSGAPNPTLTLTGPEGASAFFAVFQPQGG